MANRGSKLRECGHFRRLGVREGDQSYAVRRFAEASEPPYVVLNNRLSLSETLQMAVHCPAIK
jgi:GST-like protein